MGSNTTHGLPYPVGTDRLMDGDNAIQALAEALDPFNYKCQGGATWPAHTGTITAWIRFNTGGAADPNFPVTPGVTVNVDGITVANAGLYLVTLNVGWATGSAGTTGRRGVGFSVAAASPTTYQNVDSWPNVASGNMFISAPMICAANTQISFWRYLEIANQSANQTAVASVVRLGP